MRRQELGQSRMARIKLLHETRRHYKVMEWQFSEVYVSLPGEVLTLARVMTCHDKKECGLRT